MEQKDRKFTRALNTQNIYAKKHKTFDMQGVWKDSFGEAERYGAWLIYGSEKNGKTWFTLMLSNYLSEFSRLHYISAEEGFSKGFIETCKRVKIAHKKRNLNYVEYEPLTELYIRLKSDNGPRIVVIDNLTFYNDELKNGALRQLLLDFPSVLFIFLAHEERGEPYTATGKMVKRMAKIIIHVKGLNCTISGRCPGGVLAIDEAKAALYHGQSIIPNK